MSTVIGVDSALAGLNGIDLSESGPGTSTALTLDSSNSWIEERDALVAHISELFADVRTQEAAYLRANMDLAWTLIGAKSALYRAFGPSIFVRLALVPDVDGEEKRSQLFA